MSRKLLFEKKSIWLILKIILIKTFKINWNRNTRWWRPISCIRQKVKLTRRNSHDRWALSTPAIPNSTRCQSNCSTTSRKVVENTLIFWVSLRIQNRYSIRGFGCPTCWLKASLKRILYFLWLFVCFWRENFSFKGKILIIFSLFE